MQLKKVKAWKATNPAGEQATFTCESKAYEYATMGGLISQTFIHVEDK